MHFYSQHSNFFKKIKFLLYFPNHSKMKKKPFDILFWFLGDHDSGLVFMNQDIDGRSREASPLLPGLPWLKTAVVCDACVYHRD